MQLNLKSVLNTISDRTIQFPSEMEANYDQQNKQ
ncbi:unnamed protein product [Paramecium primaurelia]|uniref:Uncharacterized protein n=1 Tax=Paramecium primaurelia TaxID=5886 RepID=A0A8S1L7E6_PARPR|nr:unnamed protein product [Paramecium primaurelia]